MNLLLIKPSSLGDVLHGIPAAQAIKKLKPDCKLTWLVNAAFEPLLRLVPGVDEVLIFDRGGWKNPGDFFQNLKKLRDLVGELRARKFDAVLDLQGLFRSGFLAWATGAPRRMGLSNAREGSSLFYTDLADTLGKAHAVDKNMAAVKALFPNEPLPEARFELKTPQAIHDKVSAILRNLNVREPFCLLAPGARWISKKWPAHHFWELAKNILSARGTDVVLIGDNADEKEWEQRLKEAPPGIFSLLGKTSLLELTEVIRRAEFLLCNDSGPMHLAVAVGTKAFVLMGPTDPAKTGPYHFPNRVAAAPGSGATGANAEVIRLGLPCSPCLQRLCPRTDNKDECLKMISPEDVLKKLVGVSIGIKS